MKIVFIAFCLSVVYCFVNGASIKKRRTADLPCRVKDGDISLTEKQLEAYLKDISANINNFNFRVESRLQFMEENYGITDNINNESFMDFPVQNAVTDKRIFVNNFCNKITSFLKTMKEHYDMLNQFSNYLEQLYPTAKDKSAYDSLIRIQSDVYDVMCNIKMTLKSKYKDPSSIVPSGNLSDNFMQGRKKPIRRITQQLSEYVTVLDGRRLSMYLDELYISFDINFTCMLS